MEEKKISFSFKKKTDKRKFVKPEEKLSKVPDEEYISGIEAGLNATLVCTVKQGEAGAGKSSLVKPSSKDLKISDKEPTLDDYEETPVEGFGLAMLRSMGWTESDAKIKSTLPTENYIRPEGVGLGYKLSEK